MPELEFVSTPNPNALRCDAPGGRWPVASAGSGVGDGAGRALRSYRSVAAAEAAGDDFAHQLLLIPGVTGVLVHDNWLTVSKEAGVKWPAIRRAVRKVVTAAAGAGRP